MPNVCYVLELNTTRKYCRLISYQFVSLLEFALRHVLRRRFVVYGIETVVTRSVPFRLHNQRGQVKQSDRTCTCVCDSQIRDFVALPNSILVGLVYHP